MGYQEMIRCEKCGHGESCTHEYKCRPVDCSAALQAYHQALGNALLLFNGSKQAQIDAVQKLEDVLESLMQAYEDDKAAVLIMEEATVELKETGCDRTCRMNSCECKKILSRASGIDHLQIKALLGAIRELKDAICNLQEGLRLYEKSDAIYEEYNECVHFPCDTK